jgi:SAM-dependent methyltransferase
MGYALPELYDALYSYKDYAAEAARITEIVRARKPGARTLLDVACGTGKHLEQLRETFEVAGADIDEGLLAIASGRLAGIPLELADMRELDLGRRFDAVTCLFSAVGHLGSSAELDAAITAIARHLEPGGVLIVEPWLEPQVWDEGRLHLLTVDEPELKIARVTRAGRRGTTALLDFHYLVATPAGIDTHEERQELELFTNAEYTRAFERAGLAVEHDPEGLIGRGLFVGAAE